LSRAGQVRHVPLTAFRLVRYSGLSQEFFIGLQANCNQKACACVSGYHPI
jgi:plasmid maintenance system antidote protein VapI